MDHQHYMRIALAQAEEALAAGEFPVGCVVAGKDGVVASGRRQHSRDGQANELDHAEIVALHQLFTSHPELDRSSLTVYSTMEPCLMCYAALLLNGITRIVYAYEDAMGGGTALELEHLTPLYRAMRVEIIPHVLRQESLALFKSFFNNPANHYWQDSHLARYTLSQP